MSKLEFLYLSQKDVIASGGLDMGKIIKKLEEVFSIHSNGDFVLPPKVSVRWGDAHSEETRGRINAMPGYVGGPVNSAGIKWIGGAPQNPFKYGMPRASALIVLNDPETLFPIAVMDGTVISAMRTGAVTGVAAKRLARPESSIAGLIGAGTQNRTQLMALKIVLPQLKEVTIFDLKQERSAKFALDVGKELGIDIKPVKSSREAVEGADVVVTATTAKEPVVKADWFNPGCYYSHVGSYEAEYAVIEKANKIVVDDWHQIKHRGVQTLAIMHAEGLIGDDDIYAELGDIVTGKKLGRENGKEFIYFNSVGLALEDVAVAKMIYDAAVSENRGVRLELWEKPHWV
ncbi:MAG: ornithine cyclodeaminase family protein [Deltaproteobacteria bacterium]|nr:ornithine cyclodeaminase family protein [Deltaproteobacteria bacterium]